MPTKNKDKNSSKKTGKKRKPQKNANPLIEKISDNTGNTNNEEDKNNENSHIMKSKNLKSTQKGKKSEKTKKKQKAKEEIDETETETPEQLEKRQNKAFVIVSIAIVLFVAAVIFGVKLLPHQKTTLTLQDMLDNTAKGERSDTQYMYNGYAFVYMDGLWYTQVQTTGKVFTLPMHFGPREVREVPFKGFLAAYMTYMQNKPIDGEKPAVYVTFDATSPEQKFLALADAELLFNLVKTTNVKTIPACIENKTEACADLPIITCNNTKAPVIFLDHSGTSKVEMTDNCLTISGYGLDLLRSADRFLYALYGVMPAS